MRKTTLFATAAALLCTNAAIATEWVSIGSGTKGEAFYAPSMMHNYDGTATAWMQQNYVKPQTNERGQAVDQAKLRYVFDCAKGTAGVMQAVILLKGKQIDMIAQTFEMAKNEQDGVPANSLIQHVMNLSCAQPPAPVPRSGVTAETVN